MELIGDSDNAIFQVAASGKLSSEDYTQFEPAVSKLAVSKLIESCGKIKVLFVMQDFHGWEPGAIWEDIKFATQHCRDIDRIAMVGENTRQKWMASICRPFTMSKIKYYDARQEGAAREWLEASSLIPKRRRLHGGRHRAPHMIQSSR